MAEQYRVVSYHTDRTNSTWPPAQETYGNNTSLHPGYNPASMQLTRTTRSPTDCDRAIATTRHRRRKHSRVRTRSGSLGYQHQQRRRRSYTSSSSSSSSSSSGDENHHKGKEIGATLVGAAGGGALAKEVLGGGKLATLGGAVAGAVAANALEKRHERHKDERRSGFSDRDYPDNNNRRHHHHHHHRNSLDPREIKDEIKDKLTDFFSPGSHHESGKRSRSHSGGGSRRSSRR